MAGKRIKARSNSTVAKAYGKAKSTAKALGPSGLANALGKRLLGDKTKAPGRKTVKAKKK